MATICPKCKGKGCKTRKGKWMECSACMGTGEILSPENCKDGAHGHCEDIDYKEDRLTVCHDCKAVMRRCEVYSRVVGYLAPIDRWNKGKKEEFANRMTYKLEEKC